LFVDNKILPKEVKYAAMGQASDCLRDSIRTVIIL